jgi:5'-3' exonuclease
MGVARFFLWLKQNFPNHMKVVKNDDKMIVEIDNFIIDLNGVFHNSAQKIYQYGNFKPKHIRLLTKEKQIVNDNKTNLLVYKDVCETIEKLLMTVSPKKRLILCVDGPAPLAKQMQQRQRRFRTTTEINEKFDTCQITPGTRFMDNLTKYIDWYIRKRISESEVWKNIEIIFSNEKAPGEGESKGIMYIKKNKNIDESYCIHGADADLIMLGLSTYLPKFYILRDDIYDNLNKFFCIDIGNIGKELTEIMKWESDLYLYDNLCAINDFIFMCFMLGNDFIPHIPSIEILEGGIDVMLSIYKDTGKFYGHLTTFDKNNNVIFCNGSLEIFLGNISFYEKHLLEHKLSNKGMYYPDLLLEKHSKYNSHGYDLDINSYIKEYCDTYFNCNNMSKVSHLYLEGMQWILSYYTTGITNWEWFFPFYYAPPASILIEHIKTFKLPKYGKTFPLTPYQQLLCVLPPSSANLLPSPLNQLLIDQDSPIKKFCPNNIEIDLSGKKNDWQGIVLLPILNINIIKKAYNQYIKMIHKHDIKRNIIGKTFYYEYTDDEMFFSSYYGNIEKCKAKIKYIQLI